MELPEQVPGAERSQFALLKVRRFLPFFLTQFFGAFNDNLFRNALVVSITYGATAAAAKAGLISNLAQALFILPFFLFSALAGQLADKYEKSRLIRQTRLAEVILMFAAAAALYSGHVPTLLGADFPAGCARDDLRPAQVFADAPAPAPERTGGRQCAGRCRHLSRHI